MNVELTLGEKLKDLRTGRKMTLAALEAAVGVSASVVREYENDTKSPTVKPLTALARFFNVSTDYLVGLHAEPTACIETRAACDLTGLSEAAIVSLQSLANSDDSLMQLANSAALSFTSELLCCKDFRRLINAFGEARRCKRELATASKFDLEDVEYQRLIPTKWQLEREHSVAVEINGVTSLVVDEEKIEADMRMLARQNAAKKLKSLTEAHTIARFAIAEVISRITDELEDDNHAKA